MSSASSTSADPTAASPPALGDPRGAEHRSVASAALAEIGRVIDPRRYSALYVLVAIIVVFGLWVPETFLTSTTLKAILAQQSITAMIALGLTVALAAGVLDLSIGAVAGLAGITSALLMADHGVGTVTALAAGVLIGLLVGVLNAVLISAVGIGAIIATLGVGSVVGGLVVAWSGNQNVVGLQPSFVAIGFNTWWGLAVPFWVLVALALVVWFGLEKTPWGRYLRATGAAPEVARLAGVPTRTLTWAAAVACSSVAALAGVLATARIGAGDPSLGPGYLLPAFAAAFLGATQVSPGRFNVWGTLIAVYVLATGVQGLQLAGAPTWLPSVFNGVALLVAVGATAEGPRRIAERIVRALRPPRDQVPA